MFGEFKQWRILCATEHFDNVAFFCSASPLICPRKTELLEGQVKKVPLFIRERRCNCLDVLDSFRGGAWLLMINVRWNILRREAPSAHISKAAFIARFGIEDRTSAPGR